MLWKGDVSVLAWPLHQYIFSYMSAKEGLKDLPIHLSPVMPMTAEQFNGSELELFLSKLGLGSVQRVVP